VEASAVATLEKREALRHVPLFSGLRDRELARLGEVAELIEFADGETLLRQGEEGHEFFVVLDGHVIVSRDGAHLARLGPGEFLGEIALIEVRPRTATATADGSVRLLILSRRDFDALLARSPAIAHQVIRTLAQRLRRDVTVPQFGIFAQGTIAHAFLEWDLRPDVGLPRAAQVIGRLRSPAVSAGGVNLVLAFGSALWRTLAPEEVPEGLGPFERVGGLGGYHAPAAQHDLWLWISGSSQDVVFEHARAAAVAINEVAELAGEQVAFVHRDSRDLTGFIDGTANPPLVDAPVAALVPEGRPGAGGSHLLAMRWVHNLDAFHALSVPAQQRVFGRTKADSSELEGDAKPPTAHIARVEIDDESGNELPIYRRSVPYGTVAQHGLYFVAFSADRGRFDRMLARMFGIEDGEHDRLLDYSQPMGGAYYFAPPLTLLNELATMAEGQGPRVATEE
jgi:putative iron-dependent peroxidase